MKNRIDVQTIFANTGRELKDKINETLKPNDELVSVCASMTAMNDGSATTKQFLVVIARNVTMGPIKRVFRESQP